MTQVLTTRRIVFWSAVAVAFAVLPFIFSQSFALSMLSQMGIAIIFALSYNMLLGQTGLLSFGHAVYFGLGAFFCAHALNFIGAGKFWFPDCASTSRDCESACRCHGSPNGKR